MKTISSKNSYSYSFNIISYYKNNILLKNRKSLVFFFGYNVMEELFEKIVLNN